MIIRESTTTIRATSLAIFALMSILTFDTHAKSLSDDNPSSLDGTSLCNATDASTSFCQHLRSGASSTIRLSPTLTMVIPRQFLHFWFDQDGTSGRPKTAPPPIVRAISFSFFMPTMSGFTPSNYRNEFDEDRVDIIELSAADPVQMAPDAAGAYPPNMISRLLASRLDSSDFLEQLGLRCYADRAEPKPPSMRFCYGPRDSSASEYILLEVQFPPFNGAVSKYPLMRTHYFSSRHGGIYVAWRAHEKYFSQWTEIDTQIWRFIDNWLAAGSHLSPGN